MLRLHTQRTNKVMENGTAPLHQYGLTNNGKTEWHGCVGAVCMSDTLTVLPICCVPADIIEVKLKSKEAMKTQDKAEEATLKRYVTTGKKEEDDDDDDDDDDEMLMLRVA